MIFFTADSHWGHDNVRLYSQRPFASVTEMNEAMIARWNEVVSADDTVYHLGDFTLGADVHKYLDRLSGTIRFVTPSFHHDKRWLKQYDPLGLIPAMAFIQYQGMKIFMSHYPTAVWEQQHFGSVHLFGHIHRKEYILPGFAMNVGVDHNDFYPVSFTQVKRRMERLGWSPEWKADYIRK